ncbi:MAG: branched-chain amino acid transporter permease [Mycobacterium sp.]|nr:branched-chain amino acid transporter permease [Mycobacterium sp.]
MSTSVLRTPVIAACGAALLAGALVGCSSSSSSAAAASGGSLPAAINLTAVQDLSGTSGPGGLSTQQGMQVAVDEINATHLLGAKTTLSMNFKDSGTDPTKAADQMSQAVTTTSPIIFGSFTSSSALAEAPIAQSAKVPTIFTQAGSNGVIAGNYIYRATPLQTSYFHLTLEYLKAQKVARAAIIHDTDIPTLSDLAKMFNGSAAQYGYQVVDDEATTSKTVDVSTPITKLLASKPDAVFVDALLAHNIQIIKQLRQSGYTGLIVAQQGAGGGVLKPLGAQSDGVVLANDFNAKATVGQAQHFAQLYQAKYNAAPGNFAAEGYDAVMLAAQALKKAGTTDRAAVLTALQQVTSAPITGALGEITYKDQQEISSGVLVKVSGGDEAPVS